MGPMDKEPGLRTSLRTAWGIGLSLLLLLLGSPSASGIPGPDPQPYAASGFQLIFKDLDTGEKVSSLRFERSDGWDFGDRAAYGCTWVEFFRARHEVFEIHFERVTGTGWLQINDKYGPEVEGGPSDPLCGDGLRGPTEVWDGTDHFPHGTQIDFYRRGEPLVTLNLNRVTECDPGYWVPGDEPGEAWLWWDDDGPTNDGHHELDCGGGPIEPVPVVRAIVKHVARGIGYCTRDHLGGDTCTEPTGAGP